MIIKIEVGRLYIKSTDFTKITVENETPYISLLRKKGNSDNE